MKIKNEIYDYNSNFMSWTVYLTKKGKWIISYTPYKHNFDLINHIDDTKWFDMYEMLQQNNWIRWFWILGFNSIGKSYGAEKIAIGCILRYIENNFKTDYLCGPVIWIRNTVQEAETCKNEFQKWVNELSMGGMCYVNHDGVWLLNKKRKGKNKNKKKDDKNKWDGILIAFVSFSATDTTIPQNIQARLIVCDEILPSQEKRAFTMKEPRKVLGKIIYRTIRPIDINTIVPTIFISNPNNIDADIISDFEHEIDLNLVHYGKNQIEVNYYKRDVFMVLPNEFEIKENIGQNLIWQGFSTKRETYTFPHPCFRRVLWNKPCDCVWQFNITFGMPEWEFAVFLWDKGKKVYIAKLEHFLELEDKQPNWCIVPTDQNSRNVYIPQCKIELIIEKLRIIWTGFMKGNVVYFDSLWTSQTCQLLKQTINYLYSWKKQNKEM